MRFPLGLWFFLLLLDGCKVEPAPPDIEAVTVRQPGGGQVPVLLIRCHDGRPAAQVFTLPNGEAYIYDCARPDEGGGIRRLSDVPSAPRVATSGH